MSPNTPSCLQESSTEENAITRAQTNLHGHLLNMVVTNLAVSFMKTTDVTVVVTVLVNYQIQSVLYL